jgi:hypothetical protein
MFDIKARFGLGLAPLRRGRAVGIQHPTTAATALAVHGALDGGCGQP